MAMTIKQQLLQELSLVEDAALLQEVWQFLQTRKGKVSMKDRPLLTLDDLKHMECPFPSEPEWEAMWQADQEKRRHVSQT
jgi:hypothetical protein